MAQENPLQRCAQPVEACSPPPGMPIACDKKTVAKMLSVSERTVSRLVEDGSIESFRIGRLIRIPMSSVSSFMESSLSAGDNQSCVGSAVQEKSICPINAKTVRSGGCLSQIQAAKELDALLEPPIARKRRGSSHSFLIFRLSDETRT